MGGGLLQLAAYGQQDVYLTGNPQITMWKLIYKRYTNFSMESIEQSFNTDLDFGKKIVCNVSRSGDLIHKVWLELKLGDVVTIDSANKNRFRWVNNIACLIIKSLEVEIGGQVIDKHYGEWMDILWKTMVPYSKSNPDVENDFMNLSTNTIGKGIATAGSWGVDGEGINPADVSLGRQSYSIQNDGVITKGGTFFIPLNFWFCRNPGMAIPFIALQHHEVKFNLELRKIEDLIVSTSSEKLYEYPITVDDSNNPVDTTDPANYSRYNQDTQYTKPTISGNFWIDYVFLDTEERRKYATSNHEYLIEQVQYNEETMIGANTNSINIDLNFKHPVKELFWTLTPVDYCKSPRMNNFFYYSNDLYNFEPFLESAKLSFNGHDRIKERHEKYFRWVQPYQHHTKVTGLHVNSYSFALKPEEHQPTGTCNFSRIDHPILHINLANRSVNDEQFLFDEGQGTYKNLKYHDGSLYLKVFAWNYNVLRISQGMGGLLYAN